jgi:hypothetical protein
LLYELGFAHPDWRLLGPRVVGRQGVVAFLY